MSHSLKRQVTPGGMLKNSKFICIWPTTVGYHFSFTSFPPPSPGRELSCAVTESALGRGGLLLVPGSDCPPFLCGRVWSRAVDRETPSHPGSSLSSLRQELLFYTLRLVSNGTMNKLVGYGGGVSGLTDRRVGRGRYTKDDKVTMPRWERGLQMGGGGWGSRPGCLAAPGDTVTAQMAG